MPGEALAAKAGFIEPALLDHRAHGAIEQHDAFLEQSLQALDARAPLALIDGLDRKGGSRGPCGRRRPLLALPIGACGCVRGVCAGAHAVAALGARAGRACRRAQPQGVADRVGELGAIERIEVKFASHHGA